MKFCDLAPEESNSEADNSRSCKVGPQLFGKGVHDLTIADAVRNISADRLKKVSATVRIFSDVKNRIKAAALAAE